MDISDETVVELERFLASANEGDADSFNLLLIRFETRLRSLTRRMLRNYPRVRRWEQTDDVFQKSLIRLHRSLGSAKPRSLREFTGLAATQVRRTLIDMARHYYGVYGQGARHQTAGGGRAADDQGGQLERARVAQGANEQPVSLEDWTAFHEATAHLPDDIRETFELSWYAGLEQKEVARLMDVSTRTVIRRLNEARRLLQETLA